MSLEGVRVGVDLDRPGRHQGYIEVPSSTERSPFGWLPVPIVSVRSEKPGPCVVLIGGCHGDEYEGPIAAMRLIQYLRPEDMAGQMILLPAANAPAVAAGRRISPIDGGNLNRAFPGNPKGAPTERIADFIVRQLLPRADLVVDIHSGGTAVTYAPAVMITQDHDRGFMQRKLDLVEALAMPVAFVVDPADDVAASVLGACTDARVLNISFEIGGSAAVSSEGLRSLMPALDRLLARIGMLDAKRPAQSLAPVRLLRRLPVAQTICAPSTGLFEPHVGVGAEVEPGQLAGLIYTPDTPWRPATEVRFPISGFVLCRRTPAETRHGDGLFKLGVPWQP